MLASSTTREFYAPASSWNTSLLSIFGALRILESGDHPGDSSEAKSQHQSGRSSITATGNKLSSPHLHFPSLYCQFPSARRKGEEHMGIGKVCYNLPRSLSAWMALCIHVWKEFSCAKMKQNKTKIPLYVVITWH